MNKEREICGVKVFVSGETHNKYKGTLEEQLEEKDKEIERLNNIINELEKWAKEELEQPNWASCGARCMLDKLKELKEGKYDE